MLMPVNKSGSLVSRKSGDLSQVAPTDYGYSSSSPLRERVMPYESFAKGYGLAIQEAWQDQQYAYALGADLSLGTIWMKGPAISTLAPATVGAGVTHFFEIGSAIYALSGRYIHKRTTDADWTTGQVDLGVGKVALDVAAFYSNVVGGARLAYIAMGESAFMVKFDGTTATAHATLYATAFCVSGREFWRSYSINRIGKVDIDADPWVAANWTGANVYPIGDKNAKVNRFANTVSGGFIIIKEDGIYALTVAGEDECLYPFLRLSAATENGKGFGSWLNDVYVPFGQSLLRIGGDGSLERMGADLSPTNNSPVRGSFTAFAGHETFHAYGALYNADTGNSYLMKLVRGDVWHGSISQAFLGKKITAMFRSAIGAATGHARLYLGFSDGSIAWFGLPCSANPSACSAYGFTTTNAEIYLPSCHALFHADTKTWKAVTIESFNCSASNYVNYEYRTVQAGAYTTLAESFTVTPRRKVEFPNNIAGTLLDQKLVLVNASSAASPLLTGMGLHHAVRPELSLDYTFRVLAEDGLAKRDGSPLRLGADAIRTVIKTAAGVPGSVAAILPDESSQEITLTDYGETTAWDERLRQWRGILEVKATQNKTFVTYGTHARLQAFNHGQLGQYTHAQLMTL